MTEEIYRSLKSKPPSFYRRPGQRSAAFERARIADVRGYGRAPMADVPPWPAVIPNAPGQRGEYGTKIYNADTNRLFCTGGILSHSADGSAYVSLHLPNVINPDGTAVVTELIRVYILNPAWAYGAAASQSSIWYMYTHSEGTDNTYDKDNCYWMGQYMWDTVGATYGASSKLHDMIDFTDGAGTGFVITSPSMVVRNVTAGYTGAHTAYIRMIFKQKILGTASYVSYKVAQKTP